MVDLKALHDVMLNMLVDIDEVCRKHGLCYYLAYGTLLGAVRHHGFIPWDDDADIMMPRKDYEKFLRIAPDELGSQYFVQYYKTEPYYRHPFAKIRRNGTACIIQDHRHIRMHQGIFVDVFPLENAPSSKLMRKIMWGMACLTDRLCALTIANLPHKYRWLAPIKWFFALFFKPSFFACLGTFLVRSIQPQHSDLLLCVMGNVMMEELPCSWLGEGRDAVFAGHVLRIPLDAESYLHKNYGDFMCFPPVERRQPAHAKDGTQVSATEDYRSFIPELYGKKS